MQARWLRFTVRDSRTPTTRTQKLSRRVLRNDRSPCSASRKAAVTSLFIRTPIRSQTNRKFYAPVSLLPKNVVYRGKRLAAFHSRVPNIVLLALYGVATVASAFAGYAAGLGARPSRLPVYLMGLVICAVI